VLGPLAVRGLNAFARAALTMATARPDGLPPAVQAGLLAPYSSWANRVAIQRFVEDIPMGPEHPSYRDLLAVEEGLPRLADRPVLLVWGMQDWCFTRYFLDRFIEFFPAAEVRRLEQAGHYVIEDAPAEVLAAVQEFLTRHPLEAAQRLSKP
jgi:haloalkane dehalogenase